MPSPPLSSSCMHRLVGMTGFASTLLQAAAGMLGGHLGLNHNHAVAYAQHIQGVYTVLPITKLDVVCGACFKPSRPQLCRPGSGLAAKSSRFRMRLGAGC